MDPNEVRNARLYDVTVPDWPGEIKFYGRLAAQASNGTVLEIACGTGRVSLRLAEMGFEVWGIDRSAAMLDVARAKGAGLSNVRWMQGDMRDFDLAERFALIIMPGHSFQHMLTANDQLACLACSRRHLLPSGRVVIHLDHQNVGWLGKIGAAERGLFKDAGEVTDPVAGTRVRTFRAWSYEPSTQTATAITRREERAANGDVISRWETGQVRLHCVFRLEMEHLLARAGFAVESLYGDFSFGELRDDSTEMIWVARD